MAAKVRCVFRHDYQVIGPSRDCRFTAWTHVGLAGRVRLHWHDYFVVHYSASGDSPHHHADCQSDRTDHQRYVEGGPGVLAERVQAHGLNATGSAPALCTLPP